MIKKFLPIFTMAMMLISSISAYAYNITRNNDIVTYNGADYYRDSTAGLTVYTRYTSELYGNFQGIGNAMINEMPEITKGASSLALNAAYRYQGYNAAFGSDSQYLVKYTALNPYKIDEYIWQPAPYYVGNDLRLSFRYAGIAINSFTKTGPQGKFPGATVTNPAFTSDSIQASGNAGELREAIIFNKAGEPKEKMTGYGSMSAVIPFVEMYSNGLGPVKSNVSGLSPYNGSANVRSNKFSEINNSAGQDNYQLVIDSFNEWAKWSEYGEKYVEQAKEAEAVYGQPWYVILNSFFRIDGNVHDDAQSVTFYTVYKSGGRIVYRTYSIPVPIVNNVTPTRLVIRDENGKVLGTSYRNPISHNAYGGIMATEGEDTVVELERGKVYSIDAIMGYYNRTQDTGSKTSNRSITMYALNSSGQRANIGMLNTASTIDKSGIGDEYVQYIDPDGKVGGNIVTDYYVYAVDAPDKAEYYCGDAAFNQPFFQVTDDMFASGEIVIEVPMEYSNRGDDDNLQDNQISLKYIIKSSSQGCDPTVEDCTPRETVGDMNIGQREYRRLHWYTEEEVEDPDSPITDPATGEVTGYETKTIIMERISSYGTYEDTNAAQRAEDEAFEVDDTSHEINNADTFEAGDDMWWEYEQQWPDQIADLDWKVWMERNGQWQEDGHYIRSETVDEPFDLGFYISHSRGEGTISKPTLDVNIYGISPDTGEDGELIANMSNMQLTTPDLPAYSLAKNYLKGLYVGEKYNGVADYPRIRVEAKISDSHGESGIYGDAKKMPYNNGWQDEHDTVSREFLAEEDDMRIMEVELKDSEGVVVYHADRYGSDNMDVTVNGHFDREEDLTMKVVIEQNLSSGHNVKNPTIDVRIDGLTETGNTVSTYVDQVLTLDGVEMGEGVQVAFDNISFRPKNVQKLSINAQIDDIHGENNWRENIWDEEDDSYNDIITCTTADMSLTQDIELYNSKHNKQEYLTFAEYLSFKFNIRHIGNSERQMMVVGNSKINPLAKLNTRIYNADALTVDPHTQKLVYKMASEDPKAAKALISEQDIQAKTRLFPGLGLNGYASHVQAWIKKYIVQSWKTPSGNVAAYGHILVSGIIDQQHDINYTNIRDNTVDYVQKEFKGEKDFRIEDITATAQNSISDKTGVSVQVAISNIASSYNDQTMIDKTYLDIYIDDERKTTSIIEVPTGETIITEIIIPEVDLEDCKVIEARVNTGTHQTHYEYVLKETNDALHTDPFTNNYASTIVCSNKPSETACPQCILQEGQNEVNDIFVGDGNNK